MSGIVGIFNLDGAPVDRRLLRAMTNFLAYRGPDGQAIWSDGPVGFGHTLLRTTHDTQPEHQPFTLDGQVWITADCRVDGCADLLAKLGPRDEIALSPSQDAHATDCGLRMTDDASPPIASLAPVSPALPPDVELILRAYHRWGEACVDHLLGDFAFAIWDGRQRKLFCARDQFGVKPFFYAHINRGFIFSNTLEAVRHHPRVSARLDEQALGDYLLLDHNFDPSTTTFADIRRLPGRHTLTVSDSATRTRRYWSIQLPDLIRYRRAAEYVEHFRELMELAVADRLRAGRVAALLSGGLDSTTIAAAAVDHARNHGLSLELAGFTAVHDRLIPDQERYYSGVAAGALGMSTTYLAADDYKLYEGWDYGRFQPPEPCHDPLALVDLDLYRLAARHSRVVLYGQGGDEALLGSTLVQLIRTGTGWHLWADIARCLWVHRLVPPIGSGILGAVRRCLRQDTPLRAYPGWLRADFAARLDLPARWQELSADGKLLRLPRAGACSRLTSPIWPAVFESGDPGVTTIPLEVRFPFLDLRLLSYLLALPPLPWCVDKQLLRLALRGRVPAEIWRRPKTPAGGDPYLALVAAGAQPWTELGGMPELAQFANIPDILRQVAKGPINPSQTWEYLRLVSLGRWFIQQRRRPQWLPVESGPIAPGPLAQSAGQLPGRSPPNCAIPRDSGKADAVGV